MLQAALDEFKTALNNLSQAVEKYNANLKDTKNKNWAANVESCRRKVKAALDIAEAKLAKLIAALEQFQTEALNKTKLAIASVIKLVYLAKIKVSTTQLTLNFARQTLDEA